MFYEDVLKGLEQDNIRYLVVGGVALVLHGVVRLTGDLDLMIDLEESNLNRFIETITRLGYKPKLPVKLKDFADEKIREKWMKEKNMKVFSLIHQKDDYKIIDVFPENPISFDEAYKQRQNIKAGNLNIKTVSFDDLIKLKKISSREQDTKDIEMLKALKKK